MVGVVDVDAESPSSLDFQHIALQFSVLGGPFEQGLFPWVDLDEGSGGDFVGSDHADYKLFLVFFFAPDDGPQKAMLDKLFSAALGGQVEFPVRVVLELDFYSFKVGVFFLVVSEGESCGGSHDVPDAVVVLVGAPQQEHPFVDLVRKGHHCSVRSEHHLSLLEVEPQSWSDCLVLCLQLEQNLTHQRRVYFDLEGQVDSVSCQQVDEGMRGDLLDCVGVVGEGLANREGQLQLSIGEGVGLQFESDVGGVQVADGHCLTLTLGVGFLVSEVDGVEFGAPVFSAHVAAGESVVIDDSFEGEEHSSCEF